MLILFTPAITKVYLSKLLAKDIKIGSIDLISCFLLPGSKLIIGLLFGILLSLKKFELGSNELIFSING